MMWSMRSSRLSADFLSDSNGNTFVVTRMTRRSEALNVRADAHATDGLDIPGVPQTTITLIPSSMIGLRIDQTDITSKYATHLRKAATKAAMTTRFRKHYGWDATDVESVN